MVRQYPDSDGEGTMLRLWGTTGKADYNNKMKNAAWDIYLTD